MAMASQHKTALIRNRLRLVRELIPNQELYAVLLSDFTLTPAMVEEIEAVKTTQAKVGKLLDILPRRGSGAFPTFIDALIETHQEQLAALLDPSRILPSPSSSGRFITQPKDEGSGVDQLTPSTTSSSTDKPSATKSEHYNLSSGKQLQQQETLGKGPVHEKQSSHKHAASKTPPSENIVGWSAVDDITHCVQKSQNETFIYDLYSPAVGEEPGKTESLRNGRCLVFRNDSIKKHGYDPKCDDINLIEAFKKFGIKVESAMATTSPEMVHQRLHTEIETSSSAFFLFMFAPGSGDSIVMENNRFMPTDEIVDIVRKSVALQGKPKVLVFHLVDSGPVDHLDSVPEPAPVLQFSHLSLNANDDNLAILKVALSSDTNDLNVHWLVSSLIFLMTKYSKNYDLRTILDRVKLILEKQGYSVSLSNSLKSGLYFTS